MFNLDLKPLILSDERIDTLRNQSLQSYNNKIDLYTRDYKLSKDDSEVLLSSKELSKYFEDTLEVIFEPKLASKWIITEIIKYIGLSSFVLEVANFAQFLKVMKDGKINNNSGKDLLEKLARSNDDVNSLIESMDLVQESSEDLLSSIIDQVLDDQEKLDEAIERQAEIFVKGPKKAYAGVKKLLNISFDNGLETQMDIEGINISENAESLDGIEGLKAFSEKRKPNFNE